MTLTLITGERLRIGPTSIGLPTIRSVDGSALPQTRQVGDEVYLRPASWQGIDASAFNLKDIVDAPERVPLRLTFPAGRPVRALPGIELDRDSRRSTGGKRTLIGYYDATRPLPDGLQAALRQLDNVAGTRPTTSRVSDTADTHALTISATTPDGRPLNGDLLYLRTSPGEPVSGYRLLRGTRTLRLPPGDYSLMVNGKIRTITEEIQLSSDIERTFDLAEATMRPTASVPGSSPYIEFNAVWRVVPGLDAIGTGAFAPLRYRPAPVPKTGQLFVDHEVLFQPDVDPEPVREMTSVAHIESGIPDTMHYEYSADDFATVQARIFAPGRRVKRSALGSLGIPFGNPDYGFFVPVLLVQRPDTVTLHLQGSEQHSWLTLAADLSNTYADMATVDTYLPGTNARIHPFRAPLTPIADRGGPEGGGFATGCSLCVSNDRLWGSLPLVSSAGSSDYGYLWTSSRARWTLSSGDDILARGSESLDLYGVPNTAGRRLRLDARVAPSAPAGGLQTRARSTFDFAVPDHDDTVPMLRADYVPPTTLRSIGRPGRIRYPITFDNLGPAANRIARARVAISTDGRTWRTLDLRRTDDNTFTVSYRNPYRTKQRTTLSLRVTAVDDQGNRIRETVRNAYLLPRA